MNESLLALPLWLDLTLSALVLVGAGFTLVGSAARSAEPA